MTTTNLNGVHDDMLDGFFHAHDLLDVVLLLITVDGASEDELQQPSRLHHVASLRDHGKVGHVKVADVLAQDVGIKIQHSLQHLLQVGQLEPPVGRGNVGLQLGQPLGVEEVGVDEGEAAGNDDAVRQIRNRLRGMLLLLLLLLLFRLGR